MSSINREAREGLMRAWLEVLRERHPDVAWIPADTPPVGNHAMQPNADPTQPVMLVGS